MSNKPDPLVTTSMLTPLTTKWENQIETPLDTKTRIDTPFDTKTQIEKPSNTSETPLGTVSWIENPINNERIMLETNQYKTPLVNISQIENPKSIETPMSKPDQTKSPLVTVLQIENSKHHSLLIIIIKLDTGEVHSCFTLMLVSGLFFFHKHFNFIFHGIEIFLLLMCIFSSVPSPKFETAMGVSLGKTSFF